MTGEYQIDIAFGRGSVPIQADPSLADWQVIRPSFEAALPGAAEKFRVAARRPIGSAPLRDVVKPSDRVVIVTSDGTRAVPNRLLIPWILEELPVSDDRVTVLLGNGTHRANTDEEIAGMFGEDVAKRVKILNHDAYDADGHGRVGRTDGGTEVSINKVYLEADRRIAVGFIEPHFFAGFSGGPKGVAPGVASIDTIFGLHRTELVAHPNSTWGILEDNPLHREIRDAVALCPPDFMVNVTLNSEKEITAFYLGDYREAHLAGCAAVKASSMAPVSAPFPVVVTSNSGFPLDQNLYQAVKGMSAAARVVTEGGAILVASECSDGVPNHGNFARLMQEGKTPQDVLRAVYAQEPILDQWQAQTLGVILEKAEVGVYTKMDEAMVRSCKLSVVEDLDAALREKVAEIGKGARVAVLPDGPLTIPYVEEG